MKITLPLPPNMANSRMHWRVRNKERSAYFNACVYRWQRDLSRDEVHAIGASPVPAHAKVTATIYCGGRMDHDNAIARLKWPIDWMVSCQYLAGDNPSQLSWDWPIKQVVGRKQEYRVEFEITEEPA